MKTTHTKRDLGYGYNWKTVSDPDGGQPSDTYYYKRNKVRHKILTSGLARQMAGYFMIEIDLRKVRAWLEEIGQPEESERRPNQVDLTICPPIVSGLFLAALTIYGKCFTRAEGRRVKLERKIFDDHQSKSHQYLKSHQYFMDLRHKLAAHSGSTLLEDADVVFLMPPKNKPNVWPMVFNIGRQVQTALSSNMETDDDNPSFAELVEYVESWVSNKVNLLKKKVWVEETENHVRSEYNADPEMLAKVKTMETILETEDF